MSRHPDYIQAKPLQTRGEAGLPGSIGKQGAGSPQRHRQAKKRQRPPRLGLLLFLLIGLILLAGLFLLRDRLPGVKFLGRRFISFLKAPSEQTDGNELERSRRGSSLPAHSPAGKDEALDDESSDQQATSQKSGGVGLSGDFEQKTYSEPSMLEQFSAASLLGRDKLHSLPAKELSEADRQKLSTLKNALIDTDFDTAAVPSEAYLLMDFATGLPLAEKNADEPLAPASLTKVMTALLLFEQYPVEQGVDLSATTVSIEAEDLEGLAEANASVAGLESGDQLSVYNLVQAILLPSGAEACAAAARVMSGNQEAFVAAMNQRARELGLSDTQFKNPTGLPQEGHVSTARDMARLFWQACQDKRFLSIAGKSTALIDRSSSGRQPLILNSTYMHKFDENPEFTDRVLAGKSGFTGDEQCQTTLFLKDWRPYILVTLGCPTVDPQSSQAVQDQVRLINGLIKNFRK